MIVYKWLHFIGELGENSEGTILGEHREGLTFFSTLRPALAIPLSPAGFTPTGKLSHEITWQLAMANSVT